MSVGMVVIVHDDVNIDTIVHLRGKMERMLRLYHHFILKNLIKDNWIIVIPLLR